MGYGNKQRIATAQTVAELRVKIAAFAELYGEQPVVTCHGIFADQKDGWSVYFTNSHPEVKRIHRDYVTVPCDGSDIKAKPVVDDDWCSGYFEIG